ncbi:adhesion G protein-coupled receptor A3-like isoform X1 [Acipenser ruthenus]|uniref:adhesion G protein-coupled receptor A3-like isoform X1 n=2 Tax=Acipenser ruthenus TaxID=7906 RepID=UPI00145BEDDA|nr:adhesion G protein-coupled receptor A3-like isoform X1 [Acipenser ruthenus]
MKFLCMVCLVAGFWGISSANRNCPDLIIDSCRCTAERSKVKGFGRQTIRIKVVCNTGELLETLQPSFLPNKTVSLILSNNKISLLKNGSFFGLRSLERLDLKNNLISTIEPGAFRGLSELKRLDLSNNRIGCLSPEMFGDLSNLFKLNLSENIFSTLSQGLFIELVSLKVLHFSTESLFCDCNLKWLLDWARNNAIQIGNETLCVYPSTLHGLELRSLKEQQLKCVGPLELPLFQMIPSYRQVVFLGDRLPFQCTATYIDNTTKVQWYHDGNLIETEEDKGVFVEENIVHDCCLVSSELILSNIDVASSGDWECLVASSRGNISKRVEIVVLETSASYCSAEWITNNKGEFRWPKTLAGINASLPCMQYPFGSGLYHGTLKERRSWRRCDRAGHWAEEDYSECPYSIEVTRVLHSFNQVSINATNALGFAQQLIGCTSGAAHFEDMMDVIFVAQMMEKLMFFVDQIKDLGDYIADIASNMMLVDEHILWMAQNEERACTRIVQCVEHIAELALTINTQVISKVSLNIALEAFVIKPASFTGMTCTAFQKVALNSDRAVIRDVGMQDWEADTQLNFKCNTGNLSSSLVNFPVKNTVAVASIQLPPSVTPSSPALQSVDNYTCKLQFIVFRNGKLFPSTGNSSNLADDGKRRSVSTPVAFSKLDGCSFGNLSQPITVALRHFTQGVDLTAAHWDFDLLDGHGGWRAEGCHITVSAGNISTIHCTHNNNFAVLMDLKTVLSFPPYPGEFLHPVVYACTAVMLLCLFASIITYIVHHSTIRISRKGWHMLLNFCFHTALTFAVFAGGINRIKYPIICQAVGVVLHYSTLSTMLWLGVTARNIYKQVTKKPLQLSDGDQPPQPKQSMLRFYLVSGGIPFLICGITAAININNYGSGEDALYCWMAWEPSLGAFYGPVAFIVLVTCLYFLCTFIQLKRHPERKYELKEMTEEQQRLASTEVGHCHMTASGSLSQATCSMISASMLENEHSFKAQLRSAAFTLFLFLATWTFGALAVSQGHFLDMIFSCLYGAFSVTLGLFILIHHCAKRDDVWHCWWSCCPSRRNTYSTQGNARPKANVNGETQVHSHCVLDSPCPGKAVTGFNHSTSGHCKLTNLQAVQNHVSCLSPITPCCASMHSKHLLDDEPHIHVHSEESFRPSMHIHRCLKSRTKPRHFTQHRTAGDREYAYHIPSSIDGSIHSSHTDSPHSTHDGHTCHRRACCLKGELFPTTSQPESSDASTVVCGCSKMPDDDTVHHAAHLEMHPRRQSSPQNPPNQNGILKGSLHEGLIYSSDSTGNIRTGPWKNETTV